MKKRRRAWTRLLFLFSIVGIIGCSGTKGALRAEPHSGTPPSQPMAAAPTQTAAVVAPLTTQTQTTQQQGPGSGPVPLPGRPPASAPAPSAPTPATPAPAQPSVPPLQPPVPPPARVQPAQPPQPQVQPQAPAPKGSGFVFNFDNADLYEVIRVMGDILKLNYVIDPKVKGIVNIHTSGQISGDDLFAIFQSILQLNGATAVKKGELYEIVALGDAKKIYAPSQDRPKAPEERYTIQIISPKYIPVTEVSKIVKPFLSDGADIIEHPPNNLLLIGDIASNIRKSLDIISLFDLDIFTNLRVRIYPILHSDAADIAKEMERIFTSFEVSLKSGRGIGITFTPIARINSLLVVSSIPNIFEKVEKWLKELDKTPAEEAKLSVFVYYVQNGKAKDLADVLKQVYTPPKDKKGEFKEKVAEKPPTPAPRGVRPTPTPTPTTPPTPGREEAGGIPEGEITIVVDETTNALIIRTYVRDYKYILETIKKLDLYPKQVLIEVFLAEITLGDENKFGLEFSKFTDSFKVHGRQYDYSLGFGGTSIDPTQFLSGIRYAVEATGRLTAAVNASANDNRLKIVSSPHLLASNNKEAKIQIGSSQPILTNTYTTTGTVTPGVVEGTIEYKDIGILLTVTPHINDGGLVTLDINIEKSDVGSTSLGNLPSIPFFTKKTAKTILSIMEGQTIVIGGLIEDTKNVTKTGVPLLSKIPLLGALFGFQDYKNDKTELLLLLTPRVIADLSQSNQVTREFREKIEGIQREMEEREKGKVKGKEKK